MFRPCIDLHNGKVKQIVGGTLDDAKGVSSAVENFVSDKSAASYARMYRDDGLKGGHVIMLGPGNEEEALSALREYPGGLQVGGGITPQNAVKYLDAGASHVIVTSYVFRDGTIDWTRLGELVAAVGKARLVLDLSCRKKLCKGQEATASSPESWEYFVVTDRWQKFTDFCVSEDNIKCLEKYCDEFLVHGVDVEGTRSGIEDELVERLGRWTSIPITYAGGARNLTDLQRVHTLGAGRVDLTIGSALDIFGGDLPWSDVVAWNHSLQAKSSSVACKTVLLATEKPFAAEAVADIDNTLKAARYTLKKLEKYTEEGQLLDAISDVDAVIIRSDIASAKVMDAGKNLKLIVRAGAGYDNIDLPAAAARNIITMNTPGANANAVAELAFGMMVANARSHWDGSSGYELMGKSLAVYGFGAVARNLHRIAEGFGMTFSAYDPYLTMEQIEGAGAKYCETVELLFDSQFVSLHCPATDETKNSINYALLSRMPKNAVLVNTARPEVVHEGDLKRILEERKDFSYVADVPPKNLVELHALPDGPKRVFVTKKKMGAQTAEANSNAGIQAAQQIVGFFERGEMRGQVKP